MTAQQNNNMGKGLISKTLDWAYSKAVVGFTGVDSSYDLANNYLDQKGTLDQQVDSLIRWQVAKAAASGFVTGLGGVTIMPLTIPANVASVIYLQVRMIAAIAYMGGHDITSDKVKSLIYISMAGNGAKEILKDFSIRSGEKILTKILQKVSVKVISTNAGEKTAANIGKAIPVLGGIIGGSFDGASTKIIGKVAKNIFIDKDIPNIEIIEIYNS